MYHELRNTPEFTPDVSLLAFLSGAGLYICRELSTNQLLFMQNKPNVKDAQINVNSYMKSKYEKLDTWLSAKNKPKQTQSCQACVVCEGVAGLFKRDLRLTSVPAFAVRAGVLQNISAIRKGFVRIRTLADNKVITGNWRYVL